MTSFILRVIDIIASLMAIIVLLPLMLLFALAIKIDSPGPVIFRQTRLARFRREFRMVKFRTMVSGADKKGSLVTAFGDSRITPVGNVLRRTKLDELPELWNVFIGDMSLVGPRPEVPKYVAYFKPEWEEVFSVRPGITDLATLEFRDEERILANTVDTEKSYIDVILPIKMKLAVKFVRNKSVFLYFKILILTVWSITFGRFFARPGQQHVEEAEAALKRESMKNDTTI